jgi:hypothetical protein
LPRGKFLHQDDEVGEVMYITPPPRVPKVDHVLPVYRLRPMPGVESHSERIGYAAVKRYRRESSARQDIGTVRNPN